MTVNWTFPPPKNVSSLSEQIAYFNSLTDVGTGGNLGNLGLILIGSVLFLMTRDKGIERALGISTLITGITGVLFRFLRLVNDYVLTVSIIFAILGLFLIVKEHGNVEG